MCADAKTPWGGRFEGSMDEFVTGFGASLPVDREMWAADIEGSIAHVRMLGRQGIVPAEDAADDRGRVARGARRPQAGAFVFDNADEDIHMAVERALTAKVGPVGGKLHTARSRNDQVATDARLHAKRPGRVARRRCRDCRRPCSPAPTSTSARSCPATRTSRRRSRCCLPPPAGLRLDARPRRASPARGLRRGRRLAAGIGRARRHDVPARPPDGRRGARLRRGHPQLAGRGLRPRLPARPHLRVRGVR